MSTFNPVVRCVFNAGVFAMFFVDLWHMFRSKMYRTNECYKFQVSYDGIIGSLCLLHSFSCEASSRDTPGALKLQWVRNASSVLYENDVVSVKSLIRVTYDQRTCSIDCLVMLIYYDSR